MDLLQKEACLAPAPSAWPIPTSAPGHQAVYRHGTIARKDHLEKTAGSWTNVSREPVGRAFISSTSPGHPGQFRHPSCPSTSASLQGDESQGHP